MDTLPLELLHDITGRLARSDRASLRQTCRLAAETIPAHLFLASDLEGALQRSTDAEFWLWAIPFIDWKLASPAVRASLNLDTATPALQILQRCRPVPRKGLLRLFAVACRAGHWQVAQYIQEVARMTKRDAAADDHWAFRRACQNGHIDTVRYLHRAFKFTRDDVRAKNSQAFTWTCGNGHLAVVQFLHDTFGLERADAVAGKGEALCMACENGHVAMVKFLHTAFGFTREDVAARMNHVLRKVCVNGHVAVLRYLRDAQLINRRDVTKLPNYALCDTCRNGHLRVVEFLCSNLWLSLTTMAGNDNAMFWAACAGGHLGLVRYIARLAHLRPNDMVKGRIRDLMWRHPYVGLFICSEIGLPSSPGVHPCAWYAWDHADQQVLKGTPLDFPFGEDSDRDSDEGGHYSEDSTDCGPVDASSSDDVSSDNWGLPVSGWSTGRINDI